MDDEPAENTHEDVYGLRDTTHHNGRLFIVNHVREVGFIFLLRRLEPVLPLREQQVGEREVFAPERQRPRYLKSVHVKRVQQQLEDLQVYKPAAYPVNIVAAEVGDV